MTESAGDINPEVPLKVRYLRVHGASRTKLHVFEDELQAAYRAKTAQQVFAGVMSAALSYKELGIFDKIDIKLDKADEGRPDETDIHITVKEKRLFELKLSTDTSTGFDVRPEDTLRVESSARITNPFGEGETISVSSGYSVAGNRDSSLRYVKPRVFGRDLMFSLEGKEDSLDRLHTSSYTEVSRGGSALLRTYDGAHLLSGELTLRDIVPRRHPTIPYVCAASLSILNCSRPSLKASIKHVYTQDRRDNPYVPTVGPFFQVSNEFAGYPGNVSFFKSHTTVQQHIQLMDLSSLFSSPVRLPVSLGFCLGLGAVRPIASIDSETETNLSDRYFLGGPLSLRGFKLGGVGPRAPKGEGGLHEGDSLGGDIQATASAQLSLPFPHPKLAIWGIRCMIFANAGNLTKWQTPLSRFAQDIRASVGFGLLSTVMGVGRVELTYSHILRRAYNDQIRRAQIGIGMSFF